MKLKTVLILLLITITLAEFVYSQPEKEILINGFKALLDKPSSCVVDATIAMYNAGGTNNMQARVYMRARDWYRTIGKFYTDGKEYQFTSLFSESKKWNCYSMHPRGKLPVFYLGENSYAFDAFNMLPYPFAGIIERFKPNGVEINDSDMGAENLNGISCVYGSYNFEFGKGTLWVDRSNSLPVQMQFSLRNAKKQINLTVQFGDYREINGKIIPFICSGYIEHKLCWKTSLNNADLNADMPMELFDAKLFYAKSPEDIFKDYVLFKKLREKVKSNTVKTAPAPTPTSSETASSPLPVMTASPAAEAPQNKQTVKKKSSKIFTIIFIIIFLSGLIAIVYLNKDKIKKYIKIIKKQ